MARNGGSKGLPSVPGRKAGLQRSGGRPSQASFRRVGARAGSGTPGASVKGVPKPPPRPPLPAYGRPGGKKGGAPVGRVAGATGGLGIGGAAQRGPAWTQTQSHRRPGVAGGASEPHGEAFRNSWIAWVLPQVRRPQRHPLWRHGSSKGPNGDVARVSAVAVERSGRSGSPTRRAGKAPVAMPAERATGWAEGPILRGAIRGRLRRRSRLRQSQLRRQRKGGRSSRRSQTSGSGIYRLARTPLAKRSERVDACQAITKVPVPQMDAAAAAAKADQERVAVRQTSDEVARDTCSGKPYVARRRLRSRGRPMWYPSRRQKLLSVRHMEEVEKAACVDPGTGKRDRGGEGHECRGRVLRSPRTLAESTAGAAPSGTAETLRLAAECLRELPLELASTMGTELGAVLTRVYPSPGASSGGLRPRSPSGALHEQIAAPASHRARSLSEPVLEGGYCSLCHRSRPIDSDKEMDEADLDSLHRRATAPNSGRRRCRNRGLESPSSHRQGEPTGSPRVHQPHQEAAEQARRTESAIRIPQRQAGRLLVLATEGQRFDVQ